MSSSTPDPPARDPRPPRKRSRARRGSAATTPGTSEISASPASTSAAGRAETTGTDSSGRVTRWKGFQLLHFQIEAIEAIRENKNVLLSAPTGAGKTLVAEYAIADAVARGRRCVYTAPIKALSNQKYRDFRDDPDIDVGLMTGDVTIHPRAQVLIMTTEILRNSIFENPAGLSEVDYVIFDEVHFMDDLERGTVWEESLIFAPPDIRFICLSATIKNLDQLGTWLGEIRPHELAVLHSDRRPVPLKHRLFEKEAGIFPLERLGWVEKHAARPPRRPKRGRGGRNVRPPRPETGIGRLFDTLQDEDLLPTLIFSFSRRDCERLAYQNQKRELLNAEETARMEKLSHELVELFQLDEAELTGEVFQLARHGVGFHHAGMLPIHKEIVERMFTSGLLKMLFTTETFALGINMPARTAVFGSLRKFDGVQFDYLRTRDYMQMAGRAGRQGLDTEGLVVSVLDPKSLREAPLARILGGKPEAVESRFRLSYSSILHLLSYLGRERLSEAWEKSFNQFQHRAKSKKAREQNRRFQRAQVEAHLALLLELGYIDEDDDLTAKGKVARLLYGFELQITEMLFQGVFETLPPKALAVVFVGLVHEERRGQGGTYVPARMFGGVRRHVDQTLRRIALTEANYDVPIPLKVADWGLTPAVLAWYEGVDFEEVGAACDTPLGDLCRVMRMALQLMKQVKRTLDERDELGDRLEDAIDAINRGEVDARRQLELG